jgi:hypothetical protein
LEEYPTEAFSPVLRPAFGEAVTRESETPPPNSPDYRNAASVFGNQADLPTLDLSPAQAQMSAELEMKSFSPSPLRRAVSSGHDEDANGPTGSSDMEWNSDMTEPESDDEEATRKFELARVRTLARRARNAGLRTQGPPQDEIPDTPDQVEDSQVRLESTDVQTIPSPTPDSPPQAFEVRPTGRQKRKSTGSPGPMKRPRSTPPGTVEDLRNTKLLWPGETRCTQVRVRVQVRCRLHRTTPILERPGLELERPVPLVGEAEEGVEARASGRVTMMVHKLGFVGLVQR